MRRYADTSSTKQLDALLLALDRMANSPRVKPGELKTLSHRLAWAWEAFRRDTGLQALALADEIRFTERTMTTPSLDRTRKAVDLAVSDYERESKRLYHPNGQPVYSDTDARKQKLLEPVRKAVDDARQAAAEQRAAAHRKRLAAYTDPAAGLSVADLEIAFYRLPFVASDANAMTLPELARRCEAVAVAGDRVGMLLYAREARRRYRAELADMRQSGNSDPDRGRVLGALDTALTPLEAIAYPDAESIGQEADQMLAEAGDLDTYAGRKLAAVDKSNVFQVSL